MLLLLAELDWAGFDAEDTSDGGEEDGEVEGGPFFLKKGGRSGLWTFDPLV